MNPLKGVNSILRASYDFCQSQLSNRAETGIEKGATCAVACALLPRLAAQEALSGMIGPRLAPHVTEYLSLPLDIASVGLAGVGFGAGFTEGFVTG